ncbi:hypothetical protein ABZ924_23940 [Streptomyces sp. NPDC046876]|uniref:hypothetical protein n=1 Tax=Streptomyces sp. NPDC046876 TaxID=3155616 RepID=UPI0033FBB81D
MFAVVCVLLAATGHLLMSGTAVPWWALPPAWAGTAAAAWALAGRERGLFAVTTATVAVQAVLHGAFSLVQSLLHPSLRAGTSFARQWAAYLTCGAGAGAGTSGGEARRILDGAGLGTLVDRPPPGTTAVGAHAHHALNDMASMGSTASMASGHDTAGMADAVGMAGMPGPAGMAGPTGMAGAMAGMSPTGMLAAHLLAAVLCGLWLAYAEQAAFRALRALAGRLWAPLRVLFGLLAPTPHRPRVHVRRTRRDRTLRTFLLVHALTSRGPPTGTAVL